jgi:hypothetical protein
LEKIVRIEVLAPRTEQLDLIVVETLTSHKLDLVNDNLSELVNIDMLRSSGKQLPL